MTYTGSGVYCCKHKRTGKVYVGSSAKSVSGRIGGHVKDLNEGIHGNRYLQNAWSKYGEDAFEFRLLEKCARELCIEREQYWMDKLKSATRKYGYNISPTAGSTLGVKFPKEAGIKISIANQNRTPEERARIGAIISAARKRCVISDETRRKISEAGMGRSHTNAWRKHMSKVMTGRKHTKEAREKMMNTKRKLKICKWCGSSYYSPRDAGGILSRTVLCDSCRSIPGRKGMPCRVAS